MKQRMVGSMLLMLIALVALPLATHAQEPDPVQLIWDLNARIEAGDIEGALEYVSDDIVLNLVPPPQDGKGVYTGKEEMGARWEQVLAMNPTHEYWDCVTSGTVTTCGASYDGDDSRPLGIGPLGFLFEAVLEDGLFTSMTWTLTDETMAAIGEAMAALPPTGGGAFPVQALLLGLGGLAVASGLGMGRLRRRWP